MENIKELEGKRQILIKEIETLQKKYFSLCDNETEQNRTETRIKTEWISNRIKIIEKNIIKINQKIGDLYEIQKDYETLEKLSKYWNE